MKDYAVILLHNTSGAFRVERALKEAGEDHKLIPTPRELSSDCGMAVRIPKDRAEEIANLLEAASVEIAGIHDMP